MDKVTAEDKEESRGKTGPAKLKTGWVRYYAGKESRAICGGHFSQRKYKTR